jgi:hypothetical protein
MERLLTDRVWTRARGLFSSLLTKNFQGAWPRWDLEPAVASVSKRLIVPARQAAANGGYLRL